MASIKINATDGSGSFDAYVARPAGDAPAGVVVVIQEIFGVNAAMREACDWVADMGFIAVCPDLFWRIEPGVDLTDKSEAEWQKAFALMNAFDQAKGIEDLKATLAVARTLPGANGHAGTMGFCLGGRLAFMMATSSDADVNVSYYGVGIDGLVGDAGKIGKPLLLHIAEGDKFVPPPARAAILDGVRGNKSVHAWVYPGVDHAFARINGVSWDGRAATIANGRTAEALTAALA
jgi:carboxymethylenebutenolidase